MESKSESRTEKYTRDLIFRYQTNLLTREQIAKELQRSSAESLRQSEKRDLSGLESVKTQIGRSVRYRADLFAEYVENCAITNVK